MTDGLNERDNHDTQLDVAIAATVRRICRHQAADGHFDYCCEIRDVGNALAIICWRLMHYAADVPTPPLVDEWCKQLVKTQYKDGSWRIHPAKTDDVSTTTLAYFALLLANHAKHRPYMMKARQQILRMGGIRRTSSLVKAYLAVAGQLPWSALTLPPIEIILLGDNPVATLFDISSPARVHLPSLLALAHLNYRVPLPNRYSLQDVTVFDGNWPKLQIPYHNPAALAACRQFLLDRLEADGTITGYLTATSLAAFALHALGHDSDKAKVAHALASTYGLLYAHHNVHHQQLFTSAVWDTSLAMRALQQSGLPPAGPLLQRATAYLWRKQHTLVGDWQQHAPDAAPGGWGFSAVNSHYPDVDDTAAALYALRPFRRYQRQDWQRGLSWLLAMQNDDGGWSAFDRNCNKAWMEHLLGNDMKMALTDMSTPDITGRVLELLRYAPTMPTTRTAKQRAIAWLLQQQRADGSWLGRWGIAFIYGTYAAVRGLRAQGLAVDHPALKRARVWLESIQHADGGFGEACASDEENTYVPLLISMPSQTAWALLALLALTEHPTPAIRRAVAFLQSSVHPHGGWRESYPTGAGVAGQIYIRYHSYPQVWPLMALARYRQQFGHG